MICCFYFHPLLGYNNETGTEITFNVKGPTLRGWATKSQMVPKCLVWEKELCLNDIIRKIPSPYGFLDRYMKIPKDQLFKSLERYLPKIFFHNRVLLINSKDIVSSQEKVWASKKVHGVCDKKIVYLSTKAHRVSMKGKKATLIQFIMNG